MNYASTYPDDELDLSPSWLAAEELQGACDVHGRDLVHVLGLGRVLGAQEGEHAVQLLLLDSLNVHGLEDLGRARLQFLHF